jgi:hypothetical protein
MKSNLDKSANCMTISLSKRDARGRFIKGFRVSPDTEFKKGEHWRIPKPHWNYEWLFDQYITQKKSVMEIAKMVGCTRSNIQKWLTKHRILTRNTSEVRKIKYWGSIGESNGMYGKTGSLNSNWKNGCTPERQKIYSSIEWKRLVQDLHKRDDYKCKKCNSIKTKDNPLHVHHIISFSNI